MKQTPKLPSNKSDLSVFKKNVRCASDSYIGQAQQETEDDEEEISEETSIISRPIPKLIGPYEIRGTVGDGSFSIVKLAYLPSKKHYFACKIIERKRLRQSDFEKRFENEIRIHQQLHHPGIVELCDIWKDKDFYYIIMEFCPGGELFQYIVDRGRLSEEASKPFMIEILQSISYLHAINVVHRDLKPENLLLDQFGHVKISDFGLSRFLDINGLAATPCGSPCYASPECLSGQLYDGKKSDCWSIGVIFFAMLTGQLPWTKRNQNQLFDQIRKGEYTIPSYISPQCKSLISGLMTVDGKKRLTAKEALQHPFLKDAVSKQSPIIDDLVQYISLKRVDDFFDKEIQLDDIGPIEILHSSQRLDFDGTLRYFSFNRKRSSKSTEQKKGQENTQRITKSRAQGRQSRQQPQPKSITAPRIVAVNK
ncbi:hypothetical protein M9Y10_025597 [Tritrichomonas musculus]|uniref:Protein kinase domain-containing protein n=1 Tax=Tritrichomonas musculus TaxID=1915356 RepID=A0ABR2H958_9EUKA